MTAKLLYARNFTFDANKYGTGLMGQRQSFSHCYEKLQALSRSETRRLWYYKQQPVSVGL